VVGTCGAEFQLIHLHKAVRLNNPGLIRRVIPPAAVQTLAPSRQTGIQIPTRHLTCLVAHGTNIALRPNHFDHLVAGEKPYPIPLGHERVRLGVHQQPGGMGSADRNTPGFARSGQISQAPRPLRIRIQGQNGQQGVT
jgi:hypothetical protein